MQINLDTTTATTPELTALIALLHSLGGRLPSVQVDARSVFTKPNMRGAASPIVYADESAHIPDADEDVPPPPTADAGNDLSSETAGSASTPSTAGNTPTAHGAAELDADGIPWDERIHASTKTQTQAGVWTKKRKVDEVLYGQVHAELQERYAVEGKEVPTPPEAPNTPAESAPTDDTDVPPPPAPDASGDFEDFAALVAAVAPFNHPYTVLAALSARVTDGLVSKFPDLRDKPDYWADFFALAQNPPSDL